MKPNLKSKALECALLMFEVSENFEQETLNALEELCKHKNAKVTHTSI